MQELSTFVQNNRNLLIALSLWELLWKGLALWKAAKNDSKIWYVVILVFNTIGILPIGYLIYCKLKNLKKI